MILIDRKLNKSVLHILFQINKKINNKHFLSDIINKCLCQIKVFFIYYQNLF